MNKVLIIAPHADDEVLGCGATIAKHCLAGDDVWVVVVTDASLGAPELFSKESINVVRQEACAAHDILGVKRTIFMDFPAPSLSVYPSYKISLEISKIIAEFQPSYMYLPHSGDLHLDHGVVYRAALVAARPQGKYTVTKIFCYETLSETEWAPNQGDNLFKPNYFVDVSESFELKISAMKCYRSQISDFPHSRSLEALKHLAGYRGSSVGVSRAEAFEVERIIM